jgi:hypothetical protein
LRFKPIDEENPNIDLAKIEKELHEAIYALQVMESFRGAYKSINSILCQLGV